MTVLRLTCTEIGLWLHFDHNAGSTGRADGTWKPLYRNWPPDWHNPRWRQQIRQQLLDQIYEVGPPKHHGPLGGTSSRNPRQHGHIPNGR